MKAANSSTKVQAKPLVLLSLRSPQDRTIGTMKMSDVLSAFETLMDTGSLKIVEKLNTPARPERHFAIPQTYLDGPLRRWLNGGVGANGALWTHQSLALVKVERGENIVVSTGTASGKSLIFQIAVAHELLASNG